MTTNTVLDAHERQNPRPWWVRRRPPTALQLATAALEECRREQLEHKRLAEYHTAMDVMLRARDKRLQQDITRLSRAAAPGMLSDTQQEP